MTNTLFITEAYIISNLPLGQNLDIKDVRPHLKPAQDVFIKKTLGRDFNDYLLSGYTNQTLSNDEITLVEHIQPALAYRAASMALSFIHNQIKNKGIQTQSGDNSASADNSVMLHQTNDLKNLAEFYGDELNEYLCLHGSLYPLYSSQTSAPDSRPEKDASGFDSGFATYDQ